MTKSSPAPAEHWAVSARASGGIVTAGVTLPSIELALLGIPPGFTEPEIQTWLRDLAGVAVETSRTDHRSRPIPPLLHHALTGLLFSQTELWSHTGHPLPFAAVFVHGPQGVAFGWVGRARAVLLVNGEPHEPQWVIVRDESGQEAMSASLPSDAHVLLTLEYWPTGETGSPAPASIDAEFGPSHADEPAAEEATEEETAPTGERVSTIEIELDDRDDVPWLERHPEGHPKSAPATAAPPATSAGARGALPTEQPGLAPDPTGMRFAESESGQSLPSTRHPSSGTFAMPQVPHVPHVPKPPAPRELNERRVSSEHDDPELELEPESTPGEPGHPVGRWLQKLMGFGRKKDDLSPEAETPAPPPVARQPRPAATPASQSATPVARPPALHPQRPQHVDEPEPGYPPAPVPPPAPEIDIEEPHAFPGLLASAPAEPPRAAAPPAAITGLSAAGMSEIFGAKPATSAPAGQPAAAKPPGPRPAGSPSESGSFAKPRVEGLTAMSSSAPVSGPAQPKHRIPDDPHPPGKSPYPVLEVNRPPGSRGPIHIDHEPVGADSGFAIPKLPARGAPPPATPASAIRPPVDPADAPAAGAPGARSRTPAAPPPALSKPSSRGGDVPEPPTEFLERFAASMRVAPGLDPAPQERTPPQSAPPAAEPPAAGARGAQPFTPTAEVPGPRVGGPPPLPSARRAAAQAQRPLIPPAPAETPVETPITSPVLRAPTETAPVPVAESGMREMLRELPLGPAGSEAPDEVPEGMLVAQPARARPPGTRTRPARGEWPDLDELEAGPVPFWRRPWVIIAFVTVMLGIGWVVGHSQAPDNDVHATPMSRLLRSVGIGGARFTAEIDTDPPGAWIAIDGKDLGRRTPSTLELLPGTHALTLSMPDLGEVKVDLKGRRGQRVKVNEGLHGSLDVVASDPSLPVQMSLDGAPQGYLPVHVSKLPPGLHELQFSGPKMQPWAQNVNVGIRKNTRLVSRPMLSPATGVVQVLAQMNDENGSAPLSGASVFVDADLRGTTPATIELPRGPHSLRVSFEGVTAPIQVIDLPGGNKRFATFQFGLDSDLPPLKLGGPSQRLLSQSPAVVSATLDGLEADDLREAWLHLLMPNGLWSRFPMTIEAGDRGAVLTVSFPVSEFNGEQKATWYLSAATKQGDEFFTDMQRSGR